VLARLLIAGLVLLGSATPAPAADWAGEIGLASDYRYRGISLSHRRPVIQGWLSFEHESGAHASLWGTSLGEGPGSLELDATAGFAFDLAETVSIDLSATYYAYSKAGSDNALEATASAELARGPATFSAGASFAPPQPGTRDPKGVKRGNLYAFAGASYTLADTPLTARVQVGREQGPWDGMASGAKWDLAVGLDADLPRARLSAELVGSNADDRALVASLFLSL
jgi:uncharacterized protein (TIGR02001 family)